MATDRPVSVSDYPALEKISELVIKEKQKFERLVVSKENLLKMFNVSPVIIELHWTYFPTVSSTINTSSISSKQRSPMVPLPQSIDAAPWWIYVLDLIYPTPERSRHSWLLRYCLTTLYLSEWLTDLGQNSASYFLGDAANDSLQRIYGISFPDKKQLVEYKAFLVEAAKRDHRKIGKDQELFFFHDLSPGSCFFLPHGARIYNALVELMRSEYFKRGYQEVISPNMYNSKLWETSGHWQNYRDDMFVLDVEKEKWALKPMNCPGHALIFDSRDRSYKELPIRMAEFGIIHRNEASGALTGLTRVRRFVQDDTHVFCMPSQITEEIAALFDFMKHIYGLFGFEFKLELSTRPENYLGSIETWNQAEDVRMLVSNRLFSYSRYPSQQLKQALDATYPGQWDLNPGDGAFYGPKIDITIQDALRRSFQCATIQLDFQLPERFNLKYRSADEAAARPVMIHRAILGSLERFIAIITEHFAGKWYVWGSIPTNHSLWQLSTIRPFWISPRQVLVIPVAAPYVSISSLCFSDASSSFLVFPPFMAQIERICYGSCRSTFATGSVGRCRQWWKHTT